MSYGECNSPIDQLCGEINEGAQNRPSEFQRVRESSARFACSYPGNDDQSSEPGDGSSCNRAIAVDSLDKQIQRQFEVPSRSKISFGGERFRQGQQSSVIAPRLTFFRSYEISWTGCVQRVKRRQIIGESRPGVFPGL